MRKLGIPNEHVQGVIKDENNALTRLADAIVGFVRDALDGQLELQVLYSDAKRAGVLVEV